jgi:hypothetical protein
MTQREDELPVGERMARMAAGTVRAMATEAGKAGGEKPTPGTLDAATVEQLIGDWPSVSRTAAGDMMKKYGPPNEGTPSRLIWFENGPWKRTIVYRDPVPHNFPKPHEDVLEQFVDYRLPIDKYDDVAAFDGSVVVERTKGEMSARCDMEPMNMLALNLAHEIATGATSVEDGRRRYAEAAVGFALGRPSPLTERLHFRPDDSAADLDETMIGEAMMKEMGEKLRDAAGDDTERPAGMH